MANPQANHLTTTLCNEIFVAVSKINESLAPYRIQSEEEQLKANYPLRQNGLNKVINMLALIADTLSNEDQQLQKILQIKMDCEEELAQTALQISLLQETINHIKYRNEDDIMKISMGLKKI